MSHCKAKKKSHVSDMTSVSPEIPIITIDIPSILNQNIKYQINNLAYRLMILCL